MSACLPSSAACCDRCIQVESRSARPVKFNCGHTIMLVGVGGQTRELEPDRFNRSVTPRVLGEAGKHVVELLCICLSGQTCAGHGCESFWAACTRVIVGGVTRDELGSGERRFGSITAQKPSGEGSRTSGSARLRLEPTRQKAVANCCCDLLLW